MGLPRHPGHNEETPTDNPVSRATKAVIPAIVVLVLLMVVLHLTGVIGGQ